MMPFLGLSFGALCEGQHFVCLFPLSPIARWQITSAAAPFISSSARTTFALLRLCGDALASSPVCRVVSLSCGAKNSERQIKSKQRSKEPRALKT